MHNKYVPVDVLYRNKYVKWHLDISRLSLSQLLDLRDELAGSNNINSVSVLDAIIGESYNLTNDYKQYKRERKKDALIKEKKKKIHKYRG